MPHYTLLSGRAAQQALTHTKQRSRITPIGDPYTIVSDYSYGVHVERAKGTLVLGGEITHFADGIHVKQADSRGTQLSQIIGPKFDWVGLGVYIDTDVENTQVVAMTRSDAYDHVEDLGNNSLVLGREWSKLPAETKVAGVLDASLPLNDPRQGGTVTRFGTGLTYSTEELDYAFKYSGDNPLPDGFIGIYYASTPNEFYLVTRSSNAWKGVKLNV